MEYMLGYENESMEIGGCAGQLFKASLCDPSSSFSDDTGGKNAL